MTDRFIGRQIGRYEIRDLLGAGGMSSVYRAYDPEGGREVALKILPLHLANSADLRKRFEREARTVSKLRHPNILPLLSYGEEDGVPYMVMPLITGGTLEDRIEAGPLSIVDAARIVNQLSRALDYAHQNNVIHRDLKPANILLDKTEKAYLADFGVARIREASGKLTGTGGFLGTIAYASPEQCQGEELTSASDLYSFGIMLYEMLTGQVPFPAEGRGQMAVMHKHISEPVPNPLKINPNLPVDVVEVVRKATAKIPTARYTSAAALSEAFVKAVRSELPSTAAFRDTYIPRGPDPKFGTTNPHKPLPQTSPLSRTAPLADPTPARKPVSQKQAPPPAPPPPNRQGMWLGVVLAVLVIVAVAAVLAVTVSGG